MVVTVGDLVVSPSGITFPDVEADLVYVMTMTVRNKGLKTARLRIVPPKTPRFTVNYIPTASLAPGMSMTAEVEFQVLAAQVAEGEPPFGEYLDSLMVSNGEDHVSVPLKAKLPAPLLEFNRILDMGLVLTKTSQSATVRLANVGGRPARWSLTFDAGTPLTVSPSEGTLAAATARPASPASHDGPRASGAASRDSRYSRSQQSRQPSASEALEASETSVVVALTLEAGAPGQFRAVGRLVVEGAVPQILDVSARIVDQKLSLVYKNSKQVVQFVVRLTVPQFTTSAIV